MMLVNQNSDFLFVFEASMTNPNGDPDQENKPRMDYETKTALVSDARRKRDCRNFFKQKGLPIFVDTLEEQKVPMDVMFEHIRNQWLDNEGKMDKLFSNYPKLNELWSYLSSKSKKTTYREIYEDKTIQKEKKVFQHFNNELTTAIIREALIDIRLFGSAMAVEGVSRTFTGPVQISWGYSMHPVELVKSNTITSIMNDDNSTFGKKHKLYYGLFMHAGTINKFSAKLTGMTEDDRELFRKALVQGMLMNQTDSKQGQMPLAYLEVVYKPEFDGFLGDMRRFINVSYENVGAIRSLRDLQINDLPLQEAIEKMKKLGYVDKVIGWYHPLANIQEIFRVHIEEFVDLWAPIVSTEV